MTRKSLFVSIIVFLFAFSSSDFGGAQVIKPKARGTPSSSPTIDQAQKEDATGPKARIAVTRFENKSAKGGGEIGTGMSEMLANALFATNRFIVLEREAIGDVLVEQDFGASGRVKQETAPSIGEIEGAEILVMGTITEFEPGTSGVGGEAEKAFDLPGHITRRVGETLGKIKAGGAIKKSHVALIIKMVDSKTGRRLASEQVEGKATDIEGLAGLSKGTLSGALSGYSKTPMEKAIRICIDEAVKLIVAKTPERYYRGSAAPQPQTAPQQPGVAPSTSMAPPAQSPSQASAPSSRVVFVKWPQASLREGPGANFKVTVQVQKGTALEVVEEKGNWYRVRLEDGQEGWIGKVTTSENP
jgi:curli biogenesis system outer membrane secretion channel CsgG